MTEKTAEPMPDAGPGLAPAERRLLAAMPLHAITSVHGEAGLRERLLTLAFNLCCLPGNFLPVLSGVSL